MTADAHPAASSFDHLTFIKPQELKELLDQQSKWPFSTKSKVASTQGDNFWESDDLLRACVCYAGSDSSVQVVDVRGSDFEGQWSWASLCRA